ncbi:MAG: hypothetical protein ABIS67_13755 [Candidatus Eisenbacteria bacterium]
MNPKLPRPRVLWNAGESRSPRLGVWLAAFALLGLLLAEVWQNARVTQLCVNLEHSQRALTGAQAREAYVRAQLERRASRASLSPMAGSLGLVPADAGQVVMLPAEYLARDESREANVQLALAERFSRVLVPEATARERSGREP